MDTDGNRVEYDDAQTRTIGRTMLLLNEEEEDGDGGHPTSRSVSRIDHVEDVAHADDEELRDYLQALREEEQAQEEQEYGKGNDHGTHYQ